MAASSSSSPVSGNQSILTEEQWNRLYPKGLENYRDLRLYRGSEALYALWTQKPPKQALQAYGSIYRQELWQRNPPRLDVKRTPNLPQGMGLFAAERLKCRRVLGPYGGVWTPKVFHSTLEDGVEACLREQHSGYLIEKYWDAKSEALNCISRANHGFPHAGFVPLSIGSMPLESTLVVVDPDGVDPGEEILVDYQMHEPMDWMQGKLLGAERMRTFFSQGLEAILRSMLVSSATDRSMFAGYAIGFVMGSPKALIDLHLRGIVRAEEWSAYWRQSLRSDNDGGGRNPFEVFEGRQDLSSRIFALLTVLEKLDRSPDRQAVSAWVLESLDTLTVFELTKVMEMVNAGTSLEDAKRAIVDYDWLSDETSILRTRNTLRLLFNSFREEGASSEEIKDILMQNAKAVAALVKKNGASLQEARIMQDLVPLMREFGVIREQIDAVETQSELPPASRGVSLTRSQLGLLITTVVLAILVTMLMRSGDRSEI